MPPDYVMMGCQFENTSGTAIKLSQIDFGPDFDGPMYGEGPDEYTKTAPHVQIAKANAEGIAVYCYFVHDAVPLDDSGENFAPGWLDRFGDVVDPEILIGVGFWFRDAFNQTRFLQNAGQIDGGPVFEKQFNREYRMLVPGFPRDTKLSEITFVDIDNNSTWYGDGPDEYTKTATQIQIPKPTAEGVKEYCYFVHDAIPLDDSGENFAPGWLDRFGDVIDTEAMIIPAGRGGWFRPSPNFPNEKMTVVFPR